MYDRYIENMPIPTALACTGRVHAENSRYGGWKAKLFCRSYEEAMTVAARAAEECHKVTPWLTEPHETIHAGDAPEKGAFEVAVEFFPYREWEEQDCDIPGCCITHRAEDAFVRVTVNELSGRHGRMEYACWISYGHSHSQSYRGECAA